MKLRSIIHIQYSVNYIKSFVSLFNVSSIYILAQINVKWKMNY